MNLYGFVALAAAGVAQEATIAVRAPREAAPGGCPKNLYLHLPVRFRHRRRN